MPRVHEVRIPHWRGICRQEETVSPMFPSRAQSSARRAHVRNTLPPQVWGISSILAVAAATLNRNPHKVTSPLSSAANVNVETQSVTLRTWRWNLRASSTVHHLLKLVLQPNSSIASDTIICNPFQMSSAKCAHNTTTMGYRRAIFVASETRHSWRGSIRGTAQEPPTECAEAQTPLSNT